MPAPLPTVTFLPAGVTVEARVGDTLLDAALDHGIALPHECGGNCSCTTCHVIVEKGREYLSAIEYPEDERLDDAEERTPRSRLACQALVQRGHVTVRIVDEVKDARR
jgi:ferredoxin, 2Fe-2S